MRLTKMGITHVIIEKKTLEIVHLNRYNYLLLNNYKNSTPYTFYNIPNQIAPIVLDFLREAFLFRGKVLFIEEDNISHN